MPQQFVIECRHRGGRITYLFSKLGTVVEKRKYAMRFDNRTGLQKVNEMITH